MEFTIKDQYQWEDLLQIMEKLRTPGGCPWDREQNHHTIRKNMIEEAYEAVEAIDEEDDEALCEELGDVLLQVVFHAQMEKEKGGFTIEDVADGICKKLVYRHPHIFADVQVKNSEQVLENWDQLKKKEKGHKNTSDSILSVAKSLPALVRTQKIQAKAAKAGLSCHDIQKTMDQITEELSEIKSGLNTNEKLEEKIGELLFLVVNLARFAQADAEEALSKTNQKYTRYYHSVEKEKENA